MKEILTIGRITIRRLIFVDRFPRIFQVFFHVFFSLKFVLFYFLISEALSFHNELYQHFPRTYFVNQPILDIFKKKFVLQK